MGTIDEIIKRKESGIDCTEQENAEIKGYLRELKHVSEMDTVCKIQNLFPQEYGEALDEIENTSY